MLKKTSIVSNTQIEFKMFKPDVEIVPSMEFSGVQITNTQYEFKMY